MKEVRASCAGGVSVRERGQSVKIASDTRNKRAATRGQRRPPLSPLSPPVILADMPRIHLEQQGRRGESSKRRAISEDEASGSVVVKEPSIDIVNDQLFRLQSSLIPSAFHHSGTGYSLWTWRLIARER